jgi:hypothetical protein
MENFTFSLALCGVDDGTWWSAMSFDDRWMNNTHIFVAAAGFIFTARKKTRRRRFL